MALNYFQADIKGETAFNDVYQHMVSPFVRCSMLCYRYSHTVHMCPRVVKVESKAYSVCVSGECVMLGLIQ